MPRKVKIGTTSMATLEAYAPPFNLRRPDPADNRGLGISMLDACGAQGVDLACLPEAFASAGLMASDVVAVAEPIPGPTFDAVAAAARRHRMYVAAGFHERRNGRLVNVAALIDRSGNLVGSYAKAHPTAGEIAAGIVPGAADPEVFDTDLGRVGLAICFDVNWPDLWSRMKEKGAELVCWLSAYEGGFPIRSLAWQHQFPIVTAVWPYHSRVIDRLGRVRAETSRWGRIAVQTIDLDQRVFHTDDQAHLILAIQERYGTRVSVTTFTEEHVFTVESNDASLDEGEIIREMGLVEFGKYIENSTRAQQSGRSRPASAAVRATVDA